MMSNDIEEKIRKILDKHVDAQGVIDVEAAREELEAYLDDHPEIVAELTDIQTLVTTLFRRYRKKRTLKPKDTDESQEVFGFAINKNAIIPLSVTPEAKWTTPQKMKRALIPERQFVVTQKLAEETAAAAKELAMWNSVWADWDQTQYDTFSDYLNSL
jgi:predicted transcriptional regulator YdeE